MTYNETNNNNQKSFFVPVIFVLTVALAIGFITARIFETNQLNTSEVPYETTTTVQLGEFAPGDYIEMTGHHFANEVQVLVRDNNKPGSWTTKSFNLRRVTFKYDDARAGTMEERTSTYTFHQVIFGDQKISETTGVTIYLPESARSETEQEISDTKNSN